MIKNTEDHIPSIEFVRLKDGITEQELNEYMFTTCDCSFLVYLRCKYEHETEWEYLIEAATGDFSGSIFWLNDWFEGQQDVEYLAITKIGEIKC